MQAARIRSCGKLLQSSGEKRISKGGGNRKGSELGRQVSLSMWELREKRNSKIMPRFFSGMGRGKDRISLQGKRPVQVQIRRAPAEVELSN